MDTEFLDIEKSTILYDSGLKPTKNKLKWIKIIEYSPIKGYKKESNWSIREENDTIITTGFTNVISVPVYTVDILMEFIPSEEIYIKKVKEKWEVSFFGEKDFGISGDSLIEALWKLINLMLDLKLL